MGIAIKETEEFHCCFCKKHLDEDTDSICMESLSLGSSCMDCYLLYKDKDILKSLYAISRILTEKLSGQDLNKFLQNLAFSDLKGEEYQLSLGKSQG